MKSKTQNTHSESVFINERDEKLFELLAKYRYLTTSFIEALLFSKNKSKTAPQRRLKKLYDSGYVDRIFLQNPKSNARGEACYFLGKHGYDYLVLEKGYDGRFNPKNKDVRHYFLKHSLSGIEFRIKAEKDIVGNPNAELSEDGWFTEFDIVDQNALKKKDKYLLYNEVGDRINRETFTVYPDALFYLRGLGKYSAHTPMYFVEIDRGTEPINTKIRQKIRGYNLFLKGNFHKKYIDTDIVKVLFVTTNRQRITNIINTLKDEEGIEYFWFTDFESAQTKNVFTGNIWTQSDGQISPLIQSR